MFEIHKKNRLWKVVDQNLSTSNLILSKQTQYFTPGKKINAHTHL